MKYNHCQFNHPPEESPADLYSTKKPSVEDLSAPQFFRQGEESLQQSILHLPYPDKDKSPLGHSQLYFQLDLTSRFVECALLVPGFLARTLKALLA
jgi:hypothetical protein